MSQTSPNVEVIRREADGDWKLHETSGLDASLVIPGIGVTLPMAEIYDRVVFPESEEYEEEPQRRL